MTFLILSLISGMVGGLLAHQFMREYSLGTVGNLVTGFLGGAMAHAIALFSLGGSAYSIAIVGGILGGVIVRAGFTVIRQRMVK